MSRAQKTRTNIATERNHDTETTSGYCSAALQEGHGTTAGTLFGISREGSLLGKPAALVRIGFEYWSGSARCEGSTVLALDTIPVAGTHHFLALVVEGRGGLVQQKNGRVVQDGTGDGDTLHRQEQRSTEADGGEQGSKGKYSALTYSGRLGGLCAFTPTRREAQSNDQKIERS